MISKSRAYLYLHIAVFLWGFTAILGDLITLSAFWLVWWRVGITSSSLLLIRRTRRHLHGLSARTLAIYAGIGILIALHWLTFFGSIKYANASIALVAMSTTALFTAFLEPIYGKQKVRSVDILFGISVVPAMLLIVKDLDYQMTIGLGIGLLSAFLASVFAVLNKHYIHDSEPDAMTFVELGSSWLFLSIMIILVWHLNGDMNWWPKGLDWVYLIILALVCTNLTFILHFQALRHITAFVSNLVINLEPVYGIIMAAIILGDHEELHPSFYIGVLLILSLVITYPLADKYFSVRSVDSVEP